MNLEFPEPDSDRFVAVIVGGNGTGKTNLLRSLRWCLYGDKVEVGSEILNRSAATSLDENAKVHASVTISFEEDGKKHIIERASRFKRNGPTIAQVCEAESCSLLSVTHIKGESSQKEDKPQLFAKRLIPESIFPMVAVDGERLSDPVMAMPGLRVGTQNQEIVKTIYDRLKETTLTFEVAGAHLPELRRYSALAKKSTAIAESLLDLSDQRMKEQAKKHAERIREINGLGTDIEISDVTSEGVLIGTVNGNVETISRGQLSAVILKLIILSVSGFPRHLPLIIDTPFGRLDESNIIHIVSIISHLMRGTQTILLMTDYEYERGRKHLEPITLAEFELTHSERGSQIAQLSEG